MFNYFNCIVIYGDFPLNRSILSFPVIIRSEQVMISGLDCKDFNYNNNNNFLPLDVRCVSCLPTKKFLSVMAQMWNLVPFFTVYLYQQMLLSCCVLGDKFLNSWEH